MCFILKKREIENYLYQDILYPSDKKIQIDDFSDTKSLLTNKICDFICKMFTRQNLKRDKYFKNGYGKHI